MNADAINTNLLRADIEAANKPADIDWLRTELATAQARLKAGFSADEAAIDPADDGFAGFFDPSEDAWRSMISSKIAAYERTIAAHPAAAASGEFEAESSDEAASPDRPR